MSYTNDSLLRIWDEGKRHFSLLKLLAPRLAAQKTMPQKTANLNASLKPKCTHNKESIDAQRLAQTLHLDPAPGGPP
jgi:hypothetical protein